MLAGFATPEGTDAYARRLAGRAAPGHFRALDGRRASSLGMMRFLDLLILGEEDRFVERTVRITQLPPAETEAARAASRAATPARTGRVT